MSQLEERFSQPKYWEELISFCVGWKLKGFKRMADRSRMNREVHVRFCGGLEVKFLRSTRPNLQKLEAQKTCDIINQ
jgi:hypothetical protein